MPAIARPRRVHGGPPEAGTRSARLFLASQQLAPTARDRTTFQKKTSSRKKEIAWLRSMVALVGRSLPAAGGCALATRRSKRRSLSSAPITGRTSREGGQPNSLATRGGEEPQACHLVRSVRLRQT